MFISANGLWRTLDSGRLSNWLELTQHQNSNLRRLVPEPIFIAAILHCLGGVGGKGCESVLSSPWVHCREWLEQGSEAWSV